MNDNEAILNTIKLSDEDYFSLTEDKIDDINSALFKLERFDTILLKAPNEIDISKRNTFPVLKIIQNDCTREWYVRENRNLLVFAYNKLTGDFFAITARNDKKRRIYPPKYEPLGPPPESQSRTAYMTGCKIIDIKNSLDIPWQPSQYCITLVCFDWVSNTVEVTLHNKNGTPQMNIAGPAPNEIIIQTNISSSTSTDKFEFCVPAKCTFNPKEFQITGRFSLPVTEKNIIKTKNSARYIVPVWFVIVEKNIDQGSAIRGKWFITSDVPEQNGTTMKLEGVFKMSLSELLPNIYNYPLQQNEYCCYMVIDGQVFGPEKLFIEE